MNNVLVCDFELRANEARNTTYKMYCKNRPRRRPGWSSRGIQKCESTQPLPDLEEEVTSTVPVGSGSAPIQRSPSSSTDVLVNASVAASVSRGHGKNQCPYFDDCWNPNGQSLYSWIDVLQCDGSCIDVEGMSRKTQQGICAGARENLLGDVCRRFDRSPLVSSLQRTFNAAWPEHRCGCRT